MAKADTSNLESRNTVKLTTKPRRSFVDINNISLITNKTFKDGHKTLEVNLI